MRRIDSVGMGLSRSTAAGERAQRRTVKGSLRGATAGALARVGLALLILSFVGCVDGVVGYGGYDDGDDGPAFDYDSDFYEPGGFDYGWWGGGEYFGGPPVYGYRGDGDRWRRGVGHPGDYGHGGFGHGTRPYRAAPPSRAMPSIPSGPRGAGPRGGGPRSGGRR